MGTEDIKKEETEDLIKILDRDTKHHGTWHKHREIKLGSYNRIYISGMITGCGLGQIYGVSSLTLEDKEVFQKVIVEELKADGIGALICTLGESYYDKEHIVLAFGFKLIAEYRNYRHPGNYKQKAYILTL